MDNITYRDGIRAFFETKLLESKAARKKAVRAKLAAAGYKQKRIGARDRGTVVNVAGPRTGDDEFIPATVLNKSYTDHLKASADAKKAGKPSPSFPPPRNTRIRKWQPPPDKDAPRAPWWQQNSSTQITYRDGIKALFESVLDELLESDGLTPEQRRALVQGRKTSDIPQRDVQVNVGSSENPKMKTVKRGANKKDLPGEKLKDPSGKWSPFSLKDDDEDNG